MYYFSVHSSKERNLLVRILFTSIKVLSSLMGSYLVKRRYSVATNVFDLIDVLENLPINR